MGRKAVDPRVAVGTLIIKYILRTTDEDTIDFIKENPYLQYFLGLKSYSYKQPFTASLLVSIRRRLGEKAYTELSERFMNHVHKIEKKIEAKKKESDSGKDDLTPPSSKTEDNPVSKQDDDTKPKNNGHLIVDATVAPSDIKYPTDLDLLNDAREKSEQIIDLLYEPGKGKVKPRTYRQNARKEYLAATKQRKKRKKKIRQALRKQLGYVRRNLKTIEKLLNEKGGRSFPLAYKYQKMYWIIQEVYRQQQEMYEENSHKAAGRIVSISQPYVRPIVRGKSGKEVEFGAKISVSVVNGYSYLDKVSWDSYNEGKDLISQIESFKARFGHYPEWVSADKIYGSRENRAYMKQHDINYSGVALGRRLKKLTQERKELEAERKKKAKQRSEVEGVFGVGKRKYDLDLVKAKTKETSESWIGMVYLIMNIAQFMRVIFWPFLKKGYATLKKLKNGLRNWSFVPNPKMVKYSLVTF